MLSAAWKWHGLEGARCVSVRPESPFDDREVVETLHEVLSQADVIVGHNQDKFDLKKFNTRALFHGLSHIGPKIQVDTLKIARAHLDLPSYSLYYISGYFGIGIKLDSPDWDKVLDGDLEEIKRMRTYNMGDVNVTDLLFTLLRRFMKIDLNKVSPVKDVVGVMVHKCPSCQSDYLRQDKAVYKKNGSLAGHLYQCFDCSRWSQR